MVEEVVFPSRSFRDVHQLVFLFQSWQLVLQEAELPPALTPLKEIPDEFAPVISGALRTARAQLEAAQSGTDIALRLPATPELAALMEWAIVQLDEVKGLIDDDLDPAWVNALGLARDFVESALDQIGAREPQD